jgi:hypothetical protein
VEPNEFSLWLKYARRGQWCRYWHGHLAIDRESPPRTLLPDVAWRFMCRADEMASVAWRAQKIGKCMLFQKRNPLYGWDYLALKT